MKRFIAGIVMSTALAIGITGCAHQQLTNQQVARKTVVVGAAVGLVLLEIAAQGARPPALR